MKRYVVIAFTALLAAGCREEAVTRPSFDTAAHQKEVEQWQARRAERLQAEDSWLTLIGLFWLEDGQNVITIPSKSVAAPIRLERNGGVVTLEAADGMTIDGKQGTGQVALRNDADPEGPTIVQIGSVRFNVIKRSDRYGLRVKDAQSPTRTGFAGLDYFPVDPKWRVDARLEPYDPPKKIRIDDVTGMRQDSISPGALVFTVDGREFRIDPILEEGSDELFIIFKDTTSRDETYGAGRYVYAAKPGPDGRTIIDFNKAYNPPCAFTPFATCPLPPPQNRLPIRIEAGEKKYEGEH